MASCHWITFKLNITKNKNEIICRQVFSWQGQTFIPLFLRRSRSKTYLFTCSGSISTSLRVLGNLWPRPLCIFSHYLILLSWTYWFKQFSSFLISESISLQLTSNTVFCTSEKCYQTFLSFWEMVSIFTRCTLITLSRIYVLPSSLETKLNFLHFNRRKWPDSLMAKGGRSGSTYHWVTQASSGTRNYVHFRAFLSLSVVYVQKWVLLNCEKTLWREICDVWEEQNVCCMKAVSWRQHHAPESLRQS